MAANISAAGAFLSGRRTDESFTAHWPHASEAERPLAEPLSTRPEYVASAPSPKTLTWTNPAVLHDSAPGALRAPAQEYGPDLHLTGSALLARALPAHDLAGELRLMISPIVPGRGKRLFPGGSSPRRSRLSDSQVTTTGAIPATCTRA